MTRIEKAQASRQTGSTLQTEVKPLRKLAGVVAPYSDLNVTGIGQAHDIDGAGVEGS